MSKNIEGPGMTLLSQFESIEVNIKVYDISDQNIDSWNASNYIPSTDDDIPSTDDDIPSTDDDIAGTVNAHTEYRFSLTFNEKFKVCCSNFGEERTEYKEYIKEQKEKFKAEIGRLIQSYRTYSEKMVFLNDFNIRFTLASDLYFKKKYRYSGFKQDFYYHKNTKIINESKNPISDYELRYILHNFLLIQRQAISEILFYLKAKTDTLKEIGEYETSNKNPKKAKKISEPLKILNRYQTALLFSYLKDVGVISYISSNSIAPIVSELTGHSAQNLRTKAFDCISDIKSGKVVDMTQTQNDPDINLKQVKEVIIKILTKVNEDLDKNRRDNSIKKL